MPTESEFGPALEVAAPGSSRRPHSGFDKLPVPGQADASAPRRHRVEVTRFERSNEICLVLLGLVQCADDALRKAGLGATAADFRRGTERSGSAVKDSSDRIVR